MEGSFDLLEEIFQTVEEEFNDVKCRRFVMISLNRNMIRSTKYLSGDCNTSSLILTTLILIQAALAEATLQMLKEDP